MSAVNIPAGAVITREMLTFKRPGTGISPQDIDRAIGRMAGVNVPEDTTIDESMLK